MSDLTDALDGATGESAIQDTVSRIRTAAAYFLLTDGDATLHMLRYLYKFILDDVDTTIDYLEQLQDILYTRVSPGAEVDFTQDIADLGALNSVRTQIGTVVQNRILAHINDVGSAINGVQLQSLVERMTTLRTSLDATMAHAVQGIRFLTAAAHPPPGEGEGYFTDVAEAYYTTTRSRVVQGYLSSAQQMATEGRYDEAMRYLAASAAGLDIPSGVVLGVKPPVTVTPYVLAASEITVTGLSPVFPMYNDVPLTLDLTLDGVSVHLPFPLSPAAEARTVPLQSTTTFTLDSVEVLDYPGGPMTASFPAGTYTPSEILAIFDAASPFGATLDDNNVIHVTGARGPGAYFSVNASSTADVVFNMSCYAGRDLTVHDVTEAWAGTPDIWLEGSSVAVLHVRRCLVLDIPSSPGQAKLDLPTGTSTASTSSVTGSGLTVGDVVYGVDPNVGAEVLRRYDGFWLLGDSIQVPEDGELRVVVPAADQHMVIVRDLSSTEAEKYLSYLENGLPGSFWAKAMYLLPLADRSEALNFVTGVLDQLSQLKTLLQTYVPTPVPDVDKLFDRMDKHGLDLAAWYLATLQLDLFFTAPMSQLSNIGRLAALGRDVMSSLESVEVTRG